MLLLVATVACSQSSTCNATQRSDWSVGGGLIKEITGCKDFGACCSYCTNTSECVAFVLDGTNCFLKSFPVTGSHAKQNNRAGFVRIPAPPPGPAPPPPPPPSPPSPPSPKPYPPYQPGSVPGAPKWELVSAHEGPVIDALQGHNEKIYNGFEGGLYTKTMDDGLYHLFPTECMSDMKGVAWDIHTMSHHWTSPDGINNWTMRELLFNSSAKQDGSDRRAAIFAPMNIFNPEEDRWNIFYIGYTCHPGQGDGAVYRIVSQTPGVAGVGGPYPADNATIILDEEMGKPMPWEGHQGDDSFHAWQLDNGTWMGFYGSHGGPSPGDPGSADREWQVGLASAPKLAGPWTRMPWLNPASYIERPEGIENPIVTRTTSKSVNRTYVAVYDALMPDQIHSDKDYVGITESADGVHWSVAQYVSLNKTACSGGKGTVRTPQGLVAEPGKCKGCYSMLYTMLAGSFRPVCYVLLRNTAEL